MSRIIERPRLTRMLDDAAARIILLVAPAGYGKTTLARQWTAQKGPKAVWYQGEPGSDDVAALATRLADAVAGIVPGAGEHTIRRLRGLPDPERDTPRLADLLVRDLVDWPSDAWLVVDDYHLFARSAQCARLMAIVATQAPVNLLIASRKRPPWVTARQITYGELVELSREDLAMTSAEAERLLISQDSSTGQQVAELAAGWPAILNLATRLPVTALSREALSTHLYDFFAEELFQRLSHEVQCGLERVALAPVLSRSILELAIGDQVGQFLDEAANAGFLNINDGLIELHPLVRTFLHSRRNALELNDFKSFAHDLLTHLIHERRWDEAFSIVEAVPAAPAFIFLLRSALTPLMNLGRVATIRHWLRFARTHHFRSPDVDLAEAELSIRDGRPFRAGFFARRAARDTSTPARERSRAFYLAGLSAHLVDDFEVGAAFFEEARRAATTRENLREALWGLFVAANDLELSEASEILHELEGLLDQDDPDDVLRLATARFHRTSRSSGSLITAFRNFAAAYAVMDDATDPRVIARFVQTYPQCAMLIGEYQSALELGERAIETLSHVGVDFPKLLVLTTRAYALLEIGKSNEASLLLAHLENEAKAQEDVYTLANLAVVRSRLFLREGNASKAVRATIGQLPRRTCPGMIGELLSTRALAYACLGEHGLAEETARKARLVSHAVETRTAALLALAITALQSGAKNTEERVADALWHIQASGHADGLNAALQGYPDLTTYFTEDLIHRPFETVAESAKGIEESANFAYSVRGRDSRSALTRREREVFDLLAHGLSNRQIADKLFISVATVKIHVRHIFKKFGVRSRTEAVVKATNALTQLREQEEHRRVPAEQLPSS